MPEGTSRGLYLPASENGAEGGDPLKRFNLSDTAAKIGLRRFCRPLATGMLCMMVCGVLSAGVCWAWFDSTVRTQPQTLTVGSFLLAVTVTRNDSTAGQSLEGDGVNAPQPAGEPAPQKIDPVEGKYKLVKNEIYTIEITAAGTAKPAMP